MLEFPRSTIYAQQAKEASNVVPLHLARRGPKPEVTDAELLAAIRADLAASPFVGEGHRKVWARLRILSGMRVAKDRVLRLMREHALLSPHRVPQAAPSMHDGSIQAKAPNLMWGTDGIRIQTVEDGWVWVFSVVDHCDAYCVGIHAAKIGNRFAALQPIAQGLAAEFGGTGQNVGQGLELRMDHGTQYTAEDFLKQIEFWGIAQRLSFKAEPQTNGVAERFNRTLKEQAIHGRLFRNLEEVRRAVTEFRDRYNRRWRIENEILAQADMGAAHVKRSGRSQKLGFMSPLEARQSHATRMAA